MGKEKDIPSLDFSNAPHDIWILTCKLNGMKTISGPGSKAGIDVNGFVGTQAVTTTIFCSQLNNEAPISAANYDK